VTPNLGTASPGRPSSAQGLRKSRASARSSTIGTLRRDSPSPASFSNSRRGTPDLSTDQKAANESYFASLGQANAARSDDLPPSQGGRYQGFGNTPSPSQHPSVGLSSAAAPSVADFQENPMNALSKSWTLFSAAVVGASRVVSENVIQPGIEKVTDPNLQASVLGYVSEAQKRAANVGNSANQWSKNQFGVDVAEHVGGVVETVKDKIGGGPAASGYGSLRLAGDGESSALYQDHEGDSFYGEYSHVGAPVEQHSPLTPQSLSMRTPTNKDDWDEWKDF
jgi:ADP-ribosylation factor GTPase-activating protein 1